jgi:hypothetical protein
MRLVTLASLVALVALAGLPRSIQGQSCQANEADGSRSTIEGLPHEDIGRNCPSSGEAAVTQEGQAPGVHALNHAASSAPSMEDSVITYVDTAEALQDALSQGKRYIWITEHLDLTRLKNSKGRKAATKLHIKESTTDIQVRLP